MKRDRINYFLVGLFVLSMSVLLLVGLYKITGTGGDYDHYQVRFANVSGLTEGSHVTYEGFLLGHIESITPEQNAKGTSYQLNLAMQQGWKIPSDSIARIHAPAVLADLTVNIEEGKSQQFLATGTEIRSGFTDDVFTAMSVVAGDLGELTHSTIKPMLQNINQQLTTIGGEFAKNMPALFKDVEKLLADLKQVSEHLNQMLSLQSVGHVDEILKNVDQSSQQFSHLIQALDETKANADRLLQNSNTTLTENKDDVRQSVLALRQSLELISGQLNSILVNVDGTSRNMNEFSRNIRQNPGLLITGSPPKEKGAAHE